LLLLLVGFGLGQLARHQNMKICLLANAASIHVQRWASYFHGRGHEVHIVSLEACSVPGATVHYIPWWPKTKQVGYLAALPRIRRVIRRIWPDILHAHYAISYGVLGALSGFRPLAIGAWGSDILIVPGKSRLRWAVLKSALKRADLITSASENITQTLVANGVPPAKIDTFPFGVDMRTFCPGPQPNQGRRVDVICTRSFHDIYNIELLLRALAIVANEAPDVRCVLAGDGPRREPLKTLAQELGITRNVLWLGWVSSRELAHWLQQSTMYVSPALSDGTSTALTEAMACGCFPIVTKISANAPWITDGQTGFLFSGTHATSLASAIVRVLNHQVDLQAAARRNIELVRQRADWECIMLRLVEHYFRIAGIEDRGPSSRESHSCPTQAV